MRMSAEDMKAAQAERRKLMEVHQEGVDTLYEVFMDVVKRICQEHSDGLLEGNQAACKIGLAKVKNKRLINQLIGGAP